MPFAIDPEVAAALHAMTGGKAIPPLPVGDIDTRRPMVTGMFDAINAGIPLVSDVDTQDFYVKADDGHSVLCRWFTKKNAQPPGSAVLYTHGGGYIALALEQYDMLIKQYVSRTGVPFMSVEYRLSPEVKAPVHVTDVYAGLKYLMAHAADLGVDPSRVAIMGDSAGGGITASLAHYIKLKGGPAVKKQILIYPMLDDRNTVEDPVIAPFLTWNFNDNITGWTAVLGEKIGQENVSPIEAAGRMTVEEARGLPPAYIDVGELDAFRDEDLEYARKLGKAGVECEFHLTPGAPHAYEAFAPQAAISLATIENRMRAVKSV